MTTTRCFSNKILATIDKEKILGLRVGTQPHRFIGIWAVVVQGRVFVRSWTLKPGGWYRTLLDEPRGVINIAGREIPVRAVRTKSERAKDAVDRAYAEKYNTPGSIRYVRGLKSPRRRATTTELVPF